jgi:hypothetical protein
MVLPIVSTAVLIVCCTCRIENDDSENNSPSLARVKRLEKSLVWEMRSLCLVVLGGLFVPINRYITYAIGGFGALAVIVMVSNSCNGLTLFAHATPQSSTPT